MQSARAPAASSVQEIRTPSAASLSFPITAAVAARRVRRITRCDTIPPTLCPIAAAAAARVVAPTTACEIVCFTNCCSRTGSIAGVKSIPRSFSRSARIARARKIRTPSVLGLQFSSAAISSRDIPPK